VIYVSDALIYISPAGKCIDFNVIHALNKPP